MKQLEKYIEEVDDELAKSVYRFLEKGLLRDCIKDLLKKVNLPEEKVMICFVMVTREALTRTSISEEKYKDFCLYALRAGDGQDFKWRDYYLKKLTPNGICGITGKPDFIPPTYPKDKKLERFEQIIHRRNKRKLERERKAGDQPGLYDFAENNPHATVYGL